MLKHTADIRSHRIRNFDFNVWRCWKVKFRFRSSSTHFRCTKSLSYYVTHYPFAREEFAYKRAWEFRTRPPLPLHHPHMCVSCWFTCGCHQQTSSHKPVNWSKLIGILHLYLHPLHNTEAVSAPAFGTEQFWLRNVPIRFYNGNC